MLNAVNVRFSYRKLSSLVIGSRLMVLAWYQARWRQFPLGPYPLVCESYKHFLDYVTIIGAFVKTIILSYFKHFMIKIVLYASC